MEMSEEVPAKTSYGCTEKIITVPFTNISVHTDYSRTIPSTNISECTTVPDDGPSKRNNPDRNKKKGPESIYEAELNNFIELNAKGKSHVKCAHNKMKLSPTFLKKTQEKKPTVKCLGNT